MLQLVKGHVTVVGESPGARSHHIPERDMWDTCHRYCGRGMYIACYVQCVSGVLLKIIIKGINSIL